MSQRRRRQQSTDRALVGNTADEGQVNRAKETVRDRFLREQEELHELCKDPAFRDFAWKLMTYCGTYQSVLGPTDSLTNFNAGRQDVGHFILLQLVKAKPDVYTVMMLEHAPPEPEPADTNKETEE